GVAYFAELDTDMTKRGFGTEAAARVARRGGPLSRVAPLEVGVDAVVRGIERRSRRIVAPRWVGPLLPLRMLVQPIVDRAAQPGLQEALAIARAEDAPLTTPQPGRPA
ncbi:MAG TPA: oxidoreductase, partial [Capillimicrobium sp.]